MWKQDRHKRILSIVVEQKEVSVKELAASLGLSPITIRTDIKELVLKGLLGRRYGYVYTLENDDEKRLRFPGDTIESRSNKNYLLKKALAPVAIPYALGGSTIFLDDSTTIFHLLPYLKDLTGLTIVTSSILVLEYLSHYPNIHTIGLGGFVDTVHACFTGRVATEIAAQFHYDIAFFSCHAFSAEKGALENGYSVVGAKQAVAQKSAKNILIVDSGKFKDNYGIESLSWQDISLIITDKMPDDPLMLRSIRQFKIPVELLPQS